MPLVRFRRQSSAYVLRTFTLDNPSLYIEYNALTPQQFEFKHGSPSIFITSFILEKEKEIYRKKIRRTNSLNTIYIMRFIRVSGNV